ncbi:MAG: methionyl-tRNA formyltransferase, partial [Magnetococcales bacterium]|nr:methionyl-tRNA formyltransferase [Magnetococcales bacterium]
TWEGSLLKVFRAELTGGGGEPGRVLAVGAAGIEVACGEGGLRLTEVQGGGGRRLPAGEWLRGHPLLPGGRLESEPGEGFSGV